MLSIALTKGRVEDQVIPLFERCGIDCEPLRNKKRKLVITLGENLQVILVKGGDVLTYLNNGVVDIGIVGSDILEEQQNTGYELLDYKRGVVNLFWHRWPVMISMSRGDIPSAPSIRILRNAILPAVVKTWKLSKLRGPWSWRPLSV